MEIMKIIFFLWIKCYNYSGVNLEVIKSNIEKFWCPWPSLKKVFRKKLHFWKNKKNFTNYYQFSSKFIQLTLKMILKKFLIFTNFYLKN